MHIIVSTQGPYGSRIASNLRKHAPSTWAIEEIALPRTLPLLIDDPEQFVPAMLPQGDLLIAASESPGAALLIPDLARGTTCRSIIAPIDNSMWLPAGLANQLQRELAGIGVTTVFPKPFCSLTESSYGYRGNAQNYNDEIIATFARYFGRPRLQISINPVSRAIEKVDVQRNSACGAVSYVAGRLIGLSADEADIKAGLILHHYPCHCSMHQEQIEPGNYDTMMHLSGYIINEEIAEQVKPFKTPPHHSSPQ